MKRIVGLLVLALVGSVAAANIVGGPTGAPSTPAPAPEIDPAGALAALTLLAGTIAVLRGRRGRK
jgi:hypothetical protein